MVILSRDPKFLSEKGLHKKKKMTVEESHRFLQMFPGSEKKEKRNNSTREMF